MTRRRAIEASVHLVSKHVEIYEDISWEIARARHRCWYLTCGQLIDAVITDDQLLALSHHLERGCAFEAAMTYCLNPSLHPA